MPHFYFATQEVICRIDMTVTPTTHVNAKVNDRGTKPKSSKNPDTSYCFSLLQTQRY